MAPWSSGDMKSSSRSFFQSTVVGSTSRISHATKAAISLRYSLLPVLADSQKVFSMVGGTSTVRSRPKVVTLTYKDISRASTAPPLMKSLRRLL